MKKSKVEIKLVIWKMYDGAKKVIRDPIKLADLIQSTLSHLGNFDVHVQAPDRRYVIVGHEETSDSKSLGMDHHLNKRGDRHLDFPSPAPLVEDFNGDSVETKFCFRQYKIPSRMRPAMNRYVELGIIPGRFLQAIICNDLKMTMGHADDENIHQVPAYVNFFYNHAPHNCWGSVELMKAWKEIGGSTRHGTIKAAPCD
ncbi:MAG: hypothetical protein ACYSOO_06465 [Planctomycetota bacterium]